MAPAKLVPKLAQKFALKSVPKLVLHHSKICTKSSENWPEIGYHNRHKNEQKFVQNGT
jgi:hypothetical protein